MVELKYIPYPLNEAKVCVLEAKPTLNVAEFTTLASAKYEVVAVILGVVKLVPVPNEVVLTLVAYQLTVEPALAEILKPTVPAPQRPPATGFESCVL